MRDRLNAYSRRFADQLFAAHPDWEARANLAPWPGADPGCFVVSVRSPADEQRELWVGTDGGEITVGFGAEWHGHYGQWTGAGEEASFAEALDDIGAILDERLVVAVGFVAGKERVSTLIPPNADPEFSVEGLDRIDYISWRGTYDRSRAV